MIEFFETYLGPTWYWFLLVPLIALVLSFPMLGRGPNSKKRDRDSEYRSGMRNQVISRAGRRCEAPVFLYWGRCKETATEAQHIIPWRAGGPTNLANAQALCEHHNTAKGSRTPPWWYVLGLESRRRGYFPSNAEVRVSGKVGER